MATWKLNRRKKATQSNLSNQNGSVLLLAITLSTVLALIGVMSFKSASADKKISSNYKRNIQCFYLAEAGIEQSKEKLRSMSLYDIYVSKQTNGSLLFANTALGNGSFDVELTGNFNPGFIYDSIALTIGTTKPQDITIKGINSQLIWGCGIHKFKMYASVSLDSGETYTPLFEGEDFEGDETSTFSEITTNTQLHFKIRAYFPTTGYHSCGRYHYQKEKIYYTNDPDHNDNFIYLRDGDPTIAYSCTGQQIEIKDVLATNGLLNADSTMINIGSNDLLVIADMNTDPVPGGDFQDAVLLVTFGSEEQVQESQKIVLRSTGKQENGISESIEVTVDKAENESLKVISWRELN